MKFITTIGLLAAGAVCLAGGCKSSSHDQSGDADKNPVKRMMAQPQQKAGSELWAENCTRCHNVRPPEYYSDSQWDTVVHHMRLRANLTGQEARKIAEFLKTAN